MANLYLKELSPNVYCVWGSCQYIDWVTKTVTVDGEVYTNRKGEWATKVISEDDYADLDKCSLKEFDQLKAFNLPTIKVYVSRWFDSGEALKQLSANVKGEWHTTSENGYVNCFYHLWDFIKPASWADVINSEDKKNSVKWNLQRVNKKQSCVFDYTILSWGFNNSYEIPIYAHEIVKYDHKEIFKGLGYSCYNNPELSILKHDLTDTQKLEYSIKQIEKLAFAIEEYKAIAEKEGWHIDKD